MLLRVPGLGVSSVKKILSTRRHHRLRLDDVARLAGTIDKLRPFIVAADWTPGGIARRRQAARRGSRRSRSSCPVLMTRVRLDLPQRFRRMARRRPGAAAGRHAARRRRLGRPGRRQRPVRRPGGARRPVADRAVGTVPPRFIELAEAAICHSDPERFALLYRLLFRLQQIARSARGPVRSRCRQALSRVPTRCAATATR